MVQLHSLGVRGSLPRDIDSKAVDPVRAFLMLDVEAQLRRILKLAGEWGDGFEAEVEEATPPAAAKAKIDRAVASFKRSYATDRDDVDELHFGKQRVRPVALDSAGTLVGYSVELEIYRGFDADERLFFNVNGDYLGNEYVGE